MSTTLLDYFPEDFLLFVDESHVTLPQVRAMYGGDYARKKTLVRGLNSVMRSISSPKNSTRMASSLI